MQVFLACALVFLLISLRVPVRYRVNLSILLVSAGLSLLLADVMLEVVTTRPAPPMEQFDTRTNLEVIIDLREDGVDAYQVMTQGMFRHTFGTEVEVDGLVPLGGIANTTSVFCNELGEYLIYDSDERGFHNPPGLWGQEGIDIVTIGDSLTHGVCVQSEENPAALIRNIYPRTLNLGSAGSGPLTQLAIIKEYLPEVRPRKVLWFYWEGDDLSNLPDEYQKLPTIRKYLEPGFRQDLASRQPTIDEGLRAFAAANMSAAPQEVASARGSRASRGSLHALALGPAADCSTPCAYRSIRSTLTLYNTRRRVKTALRHLRGCVIPGETLKQFDRILGDAQEVVGSWGGDLYFVYLPEWLRYSRVTFTADTSRVDYKCYDQVMSIVDDAGLPVIDVSQAFGAHPRPHSLWPAWGRTHYNEAGYALVADTVLQALEAEESEERARDN